MVDFSIEKLYQKNVLKAIPAKKVNPAPSCGVFPSNQQYGVRYSGKVRDKRHLLLTNIINPLLCCYMDKTAEQLFTALKKDNDLLRDEVKQGFGKQDELLNQIALATATTLEIVKSNDIRIK